MVVAVQRPRLLELLDRGGPGSVTLVCGPAGSGKSTLLSAWLQERGDVARVARVAIERDEVDATRFWSAVMEALRASGAVGPDDALGTLVPAAHGAWAEFLDRVGDGLAALRTPLDVVLDDVHQLRSDEALAGIERLLASTPENVRWFLVSRREPRVGLHRLRLEGRLVEIRDADLGFTRDEAAELLAGAGVRVSEQDAERLHERTEGWAAGLRLAALSLERHADPDRFVDEFSGSERTIADYLVSEVLATQPPEVRDLLLRTAILDRVCGPLADALTGRTDSGRLLLALEEANALVVATDVGRTWFRYHHLLADLLRLELRRETAGEEVDELHRRAATWLAKDGQRVEAARHAARGGDWALVADLLGDLWVGLVLDGQDATLGALLEGIPEEVVAADAELSAIAAADRLWQARWTDADRLIDRAEARLDDVPESRRARARTAVGAVRLLRARRLGGVTTVTVDEDAGDELRALALMNLGIGESWSLRLDDGERHLEEALSLGRRLGRPFVEVACVSALGTVLLVTDRLGEAEDRLRSVLAVSERVGWSTHPVTAVAALNLGVTLVERGRFAEGEQWLDRAAPRLDGSAEPAALVGLHHARGMLAIAAGDARAAIAAFSDGARQAVSLREAHFLASVERQWVLRATLAAGDVDAVREALAEAKPFAIWCNLAARVALSDGDPEAAVAAVAPSLDGSAPAWQVNMVVEALLLDAVARSRTGEREGAMTSVERALALCEPQGRMWITTTVPGAREVLAAQPPHRSVHGSFLRDLLDLLGGAEPTTAPAPISEPLTDRELAVLRLLPTNLSAAEIGSELYLSVHTVKTHMRKLYAKLDAHTRGEAVQRGRAFGLLAPPRRAA